MMKKIVFVFLGLLTIVSASFGDSSDEKKLCDDNPDKFVWIAPRMTCIPKNPCTAKSQKLRNAYCLDWKLWSHRLTSQGMSNFTSDEMDNMTRAYDEHLNNPDVGYYAHAFIARYVERKGASGYKIKRFNILDKDYIGVELTNGEYFTVSLKRSATRPSCEDTILAVANIYTGKGKNSLDCFDGGDGTVLCNRKAGVQACNQVADFASLLYNNKIDNDVSSVSGDTCQLICP